ncbi:hypothetical protein ILUMI_24573 [Ignelater luminosus]|uniref:Uncharacterized protein n=1 Tax=Ignelater luminosus TaxID=2038154 RepID=A0A8K0CBN0_IGNLU|nr:hypothetical protein ILUMI_24573 [Ignelater luminosus]
MEAGVGIEFEGEYFLFKINKQKLLKDNIQAICNEKGLDSSESYGLKFGYTANEINVDNYVTDDNFHQIKDGFTLKLVESVDSIIDRIFPKMIYEREKTFRDLYSLSTDGGFIKGLVKKGRDKDVLRWLTDKYLSGKELSACLLTLLHLLKKQYIKEMDPAIVSNIIKCIKTNSPPTSPSQLQYALAVLCQILYLRGHELNKQMIIQELSIKDLIPFIWSEEHGGLQLNTMMLINAMVRCLKGDKKQQLIKELNRSKNREYIFNNIIKNTSVDNQMAHELYVYQTHLLSLLSDALNGYVEQKTSVVFREMELFDDNMNRSSTFMDFEEASRSRCNSTGTILEDIENIRISFASMESEKSSNVDLLNNPFLDDQICYLTYDCLVHYRKYHYKNFCQSCIEENTYEPGILHSAERITRLLGKIMHIGLDPYKAGKSYHPLIFNSNLKFPFFLELFSRTMWLLSKTRREMKAWTLDDYSKILVVLEKQIQMVLEKKPRDYNALTSEMMKITYDEVDKQWQKEKEAEWKSVYETNPSVQTIKEQFRKENAKLIFEKRIKTMQAGDMFPKLPERRGKQQYFFMKLSDNKRQMLWDDWDEILNEFKSRQPKRIIVSDIKHFITGKACPHVRDNTVKHPDRAFTIILEAGDTINFLAKDSLTADLWIDGFSLLLGKQDRSSNFKKELEILVEMDCALHLLELQNIPIPKVAPPLPAVPPQVRIKPPVPLKSPKLASRKRIALHKNNQHPSYSKQDSISEI